MPHYANVVACFQQAQFVNSSAVTAMTAMPQLSHPLHLIIVTAFGNPPEVLLLCGHRTNTSLKLHG